MTIAPYPGPAPETHTCSHCRKPFERGIHIGRDVNDPAKARHASYCGDECKRLGERPYRDAEKRR